MIFEYKHPDGRVLEHVAPIGQAPKTITVDGAVCERYYGSLPMVKQLSAFDRGEKLSRSRQFPTWYGFRQRDKCWEHFLNANGMENTQQNRHRCIKAGVGPTPRQIEYQSRAAAERAGALDRFDKKGNLMAGNMRGVRKNLDVAKRVDPETEVVWD